MSKAFYVIEMGNSDKFKPDFLWVEGDVIKWIQAEERDRMQRIVRTPRESLQLAAQFATEEEARATLKRLFGALSKHRIAKIEGV